MQLVRLKLAVCFNGKYCVTLEALFTVNVILVHLVTSLKTLTGGASGCSNFFCFNFSNMSLKTC